MVGISGNAEVEVTFPVQRIKFEFDLKADSIAASSSRKAGKRRNSEGISTP
jgi:hypothetical protein